MATEGMSDDDGGGDLEAIKNSKGRVGVGWMCVVAAIWWERAWWSIFGRAMTGKVEDDNSVSGSY